ncbi:hypothetical protein MNBD_GAMMA10-2746 [hydrothermal vent metagenome]|uniref:Tetratricopeptide repeat protein n=1 Tax=hydrothermal vent metagenome TaxID=652676 RepID=A0A3B0Y2F0_9ZZZZ
MLFRNPPQFLILCLCLSIYSCTLQKPSPQSINSNINNWLEKKQFIKIDAAFKNIDPSDPEYNAILKRKPFIENIKKSYIKSTSATANNLKRNNQWHEAIQVYAKTLANLGDEPVLITEQALLITERNNKINDLKKKLLIKRAKSLASYQGIYLELDQLISDNSSARQDIRRYEKDKKHVSERLEKCGELANINKQLNIAIECFVLSYELSPDSHKLEHIKTLEATLSKDKRQQQHIDLLAAYKSAYSKKAYVQAKKHLHELLKIAPKHKEAQQQLRKLNKEIKRKLQGMLASGKYLYSQNKINEALKIWKKARRIAPGNKELKQLIYRTEKVSKKIKSLQHNQ